MSNRRRIILPAFLAGLVSLGVWLWMQFAAEPEPTKELEALTADEAPHGLLLEAQDSLPALDLTALKGKRVFLMIENRQSAMQAESLAFKRTMYGWNFPEDTVGFAVADLRGLGMFASVIENQFIKPMRAESRLPIYLDYEGIVPERFRLQAGHFGFVVLDKDGQVQYRQHGEIPAEDFESIRKLLDASSPGPGPAAPEFNASGLNLETCEQKPCALLFLSRPVKDDELSGSESSLDIAKQMEQFNDPSLRLLRMFWDRRKDAEKSYHMAIIGSSEENMPQSAQAGWSVISDDPALRKTFEIPENQAGLVVIDQQKRIAFREIGAVKVWKLSRAAKALKLPAKLPKHLQEKAQ